MTKIDPVGLAGNKTRMAPWETVGTEKVFSAPPWIELFKDSVRLPGGRVVDDFYRLDFPDFVMVAAFDEQGRLLFERQYRHALKRIIHDLPTGCREPGERPLATAKRELLEETGYTASRWRYVGEFIVDGNRGCGRCSFFVANDISQIAAPVFDDMELTEAVLMDEPTIIREMMAGTICTMATISLVGIVTNKNMVSMIGPVPADIA